MRSVFYLCVVLVIFGLTACGSSQSKQSVSETPKHSVHCLTVQAQLVPVEEAILGTVFAHNHALIACKVSGSVEKVSVVLGQGVKQGQTLVVLKAKELAARAEQARAQAEQSGIEARRTADLFAQGAATASARDEASNRYRAAQASADEAEVVFGYTQIVAPFAGVVTRKMVNAGDLVTPGIPLLQMEDGTAFQVEAHVPEFLKNHLTLGQVLVVRADDQELRATVCEITPTLEPESRTFLIKAKLPKMDLLSGQLVRVYIPSKPKKRLMVPLPAVRIDGQIESLFVLNNGCAEMRLVKIVPLEGGQCEVVGGLLAGEKIILNPKDLTDRECVTEAIQ